MASDLVAKRIIIPRWWIRMWFREATWDHFDMLFATGELRLPSEEESGFALHHDFFQPEDEWSLYVHGEWQTEMPPIIMSEDAPFILWNIVWPCIPLHPDAICVCG